MRILKISPKNNYTLHVVLDDGRKGIFNVNPYLKYEAFVELKKPDAFNKISNGGYFIEWDCGADLSLDTIIHHLQYV